MQPDRFSAPSYTYQPSNRPGIHDRLRLVGELVVWVPVLALAGSALLILATVTGILVAP